MARILLGLLFLKIISLDAKYTSEIIGDLTFLCSSDWEPKFGNCYRFVNVPQNQKIATNVCKSYGSKLANPKDDNEFHYLKEKAEYTFKNETKFWIGYSKGEDNDCNGYWDNFQPNWSEGNCVAMKNDDGLYVVNKCDRPYSFVCQKEACVNDSHPCNTDKCVPFDLKNNGQNDCGDNSDENDYNELCNYYYTNSTGEFTADLATVQNNSNCIITMEAPIGSRIIVEFELNKLKMDNDYLEIWSGGSDASERSIIGRPIHSNTNQFYSKNNFVFVKYYTTRNVTEKIFFFKWRSVPVRSETLQVTNVPQELKFPEGSMLFPNLQLSWKIEAPKGSIITLQLSELVLRNSEGNSLEIWYGDVMAVKLSYSTENQVFISNTNKVYIYLNSGNEACKGGFTLTYQEGCSINLEAAFGQISSPGFNTVDPSSSLYVTNTRCSWEIITPNVTHFVSLDFAWFNLTDPNDFLEVYNGKISMKNLTGENSIDNIHTKANVLRLEFTSSVMDVSSGFNATFSMSCPKIQDFVSKETLVRSNDTANAFLTTIEISCGPGYVFKQEEYTNTKTQSLICNAGGIWSKKPYPSCQVIACEIFSNIENGMIFNASGITYGSRVYYECDVGYFMASSDPYAECNEFGKWTDLPICQGYNCSSITAEPNSVLKQVAGTDAEVGSVKMAVCNEGYKLIGKDMFGCLSNKNWTPKQYSCQAKSCWIPFDSKANETRVILKNGDTFNYICKDGCTIKGMDNSSLLLTCSKGTMKMPNGDEFTDQNKCDGTACVEKVDSCDKCVAKGTDKCANTSTGELICNCKDGYMGKTCMVDINECLPNQCQNKAPCYDDEGYFICDCLTGWSGRTCDIYSVELCLLRPCKNGAQCYNIPDNKICRCNKDFTDAECSTKKNKCKLPNMCSNGGTCSDSKDKCICTENFTGVRCELEKDHCKQKPCKNNEECTNLPNGYDCQPKTDYFPCTDNSEICKTVPCHGMKSISDCQSCKNSNKDFDIFFDSNDSGGATLSRYATFKTNDFSVCMELLFSDQKNSEGTFITLLKKNAKNTFEEYLSIGSKGITLNSKDYSYSVDLNTKDWSSFCVAISENGDTNILAQKFKKISMKISPLKLKDETFTIVIGRNFYGYITKMKIFNQVLTDQFLNLPDPPYINWANYIPGWGAKFHVPSRNPIKDICTFEVDSSKCPSKLDKSLPEFSNCNTSDRNVVCPRLTCSLNITRPEANKGSIKSTINPKGSVYNWGSKNVIFEARDNNENSATCRFKLFVKYQTCENPPRFNQTNCNIVCPPGEALCMPFPLKLSCSKLGVFNRTHPFNDMLIPPCGNEEPVSVGIRVSFNYIMEGVKCSKPTVLADITNKVQEITDEFISNYTGFCHGNCSTIQYISGCNDTSDINMTIIIPYTTMMIERRSDGVNVSTTVEVEKLVLLQNVYKQIEKQIYGTLVTDSIKVTSFPECQFGYGLVNNKCVQCGLGTYYDNSPHSCYYCPLGHYQNKIGQASCVQCPNDRTTKAVGARELGDCYENCSSGFYFDKNKCTPCNIGFYQDDSGQMFCEPCPLGKTTYTKESNSASLCFDICQPGYQLIENGTCQICPRGYYRQFDYEPSCISCGLDTTTEAAGSISADNCSIPACSRGEFLNYTICSDCPVGTYQDEIWQESCISCPSGTWTRGNGNRQNSSCENYCSSGYEKKNAIDACSKCPKGFFRELDMLHRFALCTKCPDNFTTDGEGASTCQLRICPAGMFRNSTNNACQDCPQGYYQPNVTTGECLECPENYTTSLMQSKSDTDCTFYCKFAGYEIGPSGKECIPCAKGFYKNDRAGVKEKCSPCKQNFTTSLDEGATSLGDCDLRICPEGTFIKNDMCMPCPNDTYQPARSKYSCEKCPNNTYTYSDGTIKESDCQVTCQPGYEGQENCTLCEVNFFKQINGTKACSECPTHFLANADRTDCNVLNCQAGYYNATATSCLPCEKGKYKNSVGNSECTSCPNSAYTTTATGSTSVNDCTEVDCRPGYKFDSSTDACIVCPKGTYQTKRGNYPCISCPGIFTTFGNASTSEIDCLIPNCPTGEQPSEDYLSCTNCNLGYYKSEASSISCIKCPTNKTTSNIGATDVSQCSKEKVPNPTALSTLDIVIVLQYALPDCESKKAFYEEQIKAVIEKRMKKISQNWNICTGNCSVTVSINCPTSKRRKRATTNGEAEIRVGNIKADTDSKITNEFTKTENVFTQDCKINSDQYKVDSVPAISCVVNTSCTYSKSVSEICEKCPAGTKAVVTGCEDCPGGTYSAIDQRDCTNCTSPLTSKSRSNSSSECLAKCLVDTAYCKNGGTCSQGPNDLYHTCFCMNKFSGDQCEIYNGPLDPKQRWIFVGIGCIAAILVLILIGAGIVVYLKEKREEKTAHDSTFDEEPFSNMPYGFPMQGYQENKPFVTEWKDIRKF